VQVVEQSLAPLRAPLSHCSPGSTIPLPQTLPAPVLLLEDEELEDEELDDEELDDEELEDEELELLGAPPVLLAPTDEAALDPPAPDVLACVPPVSSPRPDRLPHAASSEPRTQRNDAKTRGGRERRRTAGPGRRRSVKRGKRASLWPR
jgi:hypothetical protein